MQVLRTYNVDEFDSVKNITPSSLYVTISLISDQNLTCWGKSVQVISFLVSTFLSADKPYQVFVTLKLLITKMIYCLCTK